MQSAEAVVRRLLAGQLDLPGVSHALGRRPIAPDNDGGNAERRSRVVVSALRRNDKPCMSHDGRRLTKQR